MEKYMNNILEKTDELIFEIKKSTKYKEYIKLKKIMLDNDEIMNTINKIKFNQKKIVLLKSQNENYNILEKENKELLIQLESNQLYIEFNNIKLDLNNDFQIIKNLIEKKINDITN